ncbi:MAG: PorV/PorQ family protein [bacterium]
MNKILVCLFGLITLFFSDQMPGATFLLIPPSARANGMAYAFTAIADDATACYYNAAGLAFLESKCIQVSYCGYLTEYMVGNRYFHLAVGYPWASSGLGAEVIYFYIPPWRGSPFDVPYRAWHVALKVDYSRRFCDRYAAGLGLKIVNQSHTKEWWLEDPSLPPGIGNGRTGVVLVAALDVNSLYVISDNLRIGAVLHNIGPNLHYTESDPGDPLPRLIRLGVAYELLNNKYIKCTVSGEMTKVLLGIFDGGEDTFWENVKSEFRDTWKAIGLEVAVYKLISLRGGYFYDREGYRKGFTFGGGLHAEPFSFDVGIDENIFDFPTQNRTVSVSYRF